MKETLYDLRTGACWLACCALLALSVWLSLELRALEARRSREEAEAREAMAYSLEVMRDATAKVQHLRRAVESLEDLERLERLERLEER